MTVGDRFCGKHCHVLGYGRSNRPLVDMLIDAGADVTVHDRNSDIVSDSTAQVHTAQGVKFVLGEDYLSSLDGDFIFRSPGLRNDIPEILLAVSHGAQLTSEMELFFELCPCRIIGITGSDGKTTTTTLTHLFLTEEFKKDGVRRAYVGGNIGAPLLPKIGEMTENDVAVVELSSFQLQTMALSPHRALITNISPNHLNWHTDMNEYIASKCNIFKHSGIDMLVLNAENDITSALADGIDVSITYFSSLKSSYSEIVQCHKNNCRAVYEDAGVIYLDDGRERRAVIQTSDILLPGRHNVENYMAAIALTDGLVSSETVKRVASTFGGVEHRLELVRTLNGVKYYNSSIDSSPTRTAAALRALDARPIVICGGSDKNIAFDGLAKDLCTRARAVVLTGQSAMKILNEIEKCPDYRESGLTVKHIPNFREAVLTASNMASNGDTVLLSPACASFDAFKDFAERGRTFKEIINELK